jgi:hypothetical protein
MRRSFLLFRAVSDPRQPEMPSPGPSFLTSPRRGCAPEKLEERGEDMDIFYSPEASVRARAIRICRACPFRRECDAYATRRGESYGVWGGKCRDPRTAPVPDRKVRELWRAGLDDDEISFRTGKTPRDVYLSRRRQNLWNVSDTA